jgi:heme exporter protein D
VNFDTFSEVLAMGGHGLYVWLCYGVSFIVVLGNALSVRAARERYLRLARAIERRAGVTQNPDRTPDREVSSES